MDRLERQVLDAIDVEGMLGFLCRLIAVPSLDGEEGAAQELVAEQMDRCGLEVDLWEIDLEELRRHPAYCEEVPRDRALGLVGALGADTPERSLILNGHVDVVPAGDSAGWSFTPWRGTVTDRRVYGRGAADMKGGLCCALFAAKALRDAGVPLGGRLLIESVVGEEDGGLGTLATLLRGYRAAGAIIMEPTSLALVPTQAGALSFRLTVPGLAAHAALRHEGTSAVEKFVLLFSALQRLERRRNAQAPHPLLAGYRIPYPLSIGTVRAGNWASSVPDQLVCEGRIGVAVGEDLDRARQQLEEAIADAAATDPWLRDHPPEVTWWGGQFAPAETPLDATVVTTLADAVRTLTGTRPTLTGVPYGADMRLLVNEGRIPTILFGPGDVRVAHRADEFVPIDDLIITVRTLALTALRFCGQITN